MAESLGTSGDSSERRSRVSLSASSWRGYLLNSGVWTGRRALCNSRGKVLVDVPVRVCTERFRTPAGEDCVTWRTEVQTAAGVDEAEEEWSKEELAEFGALASDGCFSTGDDLFVGERFTVDQCLVHDLSRVRATYAYDWEGRLTGVVASRERKLSEHASSSSAITKSGINGDGAFGFETAPYIEPAAWRSPSVLLDYTVGIWEGRGVLLDSRTYVTSTIGSRLELRLEPGNVLRQRSQLITTSGPSLILEASARLDANTALFPEANLQLMLLPGGVSISCPIRVRPGVAFALELTFLARPDFRKRILRCYDEQAQWIQTVFLSERRMG